PRPRGRRDGAPPGARHAPLGRRRAGRRAVRLPGSRGRLAAHRLRGRDRGRARAPARRAGGVRAERLADAHPVARARRLRRRAERHRGDAGAARADGRTRTLADLHGARVGTLEGSLAADLVRADPGVEIVLYEGVEEPYLDL